MSRYNKLVNIVFKSKYQPIPDEVEVEMLCMVYFQPQKLRDLVHLSIYNDYMCGCVDGFVTNSVRNLFLVQ